MGSVTPMTRRRRSVLLLITMLMPVAAVAAGLFGIDVYLHGRHQAFGGYNIWGYRGPVLPAKQPHEFRAVLLGGSTAYGYGLPWNEAIAGQLEERLAGRPGLPTVRVINLGYNNQGAHAFQHTLEDYRWLGYDLALLYEGYNDILNGVEPNRFDYRRESAMFRLTGYLPIFPLILREKAAMLRTGNADVAGFAGLKRTVFRPGFVARSKAATLQTIADVGDQIDRQLAHVPVSASDSSTVDQDTGCHDPWPSYCRDVLSAARFALARGVRVLIIGQPHFPAGHPRHDRHLSQQQDLAGMIARKFAGDPRVQYLDLGNTVDLENPDLTFDGMHLTMQGSGIIAGALVETVAALAANPARTDK